MSGEQVEAFDPNIPIKELVQKINKLSHGETARTRAQAMLFVKEKIENAENPLAAAIGVIYFGKSDLWLLSAAILYLNHLGLGEKTFNEVIDTINPSKRLAGPITYIKNKTP